MWCSSAVNRTPFFACAACRTRPSAACTRARPCVRSVVACDEFRLASRLPSSPSAACLLALFGAFFGTTRLSDFPDSCISGVRLSTSRCGLLSHRQQTAVGSPGSRTRCFRTCTGSLTARGLGASRDIDAPSGAFRYSLQRRHPGGTVFRGSIPGPHVPLSTLRRRPRRLLRMTRGRCGSLTLHRMTLSFTTPRRFIPAHKEMPMKKKDFKRLRLSRETLYTLTTSDVQKVMGAYDSCGGVSSCLSGKPGPCPTQGDPSMDTNC